MELLIFTIYCILLVIGTNSGLCVSNQDCSNNESLCIQPCSGSAAVEWDLVNDSSVADSVSIRLRNNGERCLQTASLVSDSSVFVGDCSDPPTAQQLWKRSQLPPPMPQGPMYAGVCLRCSTSGHGVCLTINDTSWTLSDGMSVVHTAPLERASTLASNYSRLTITAEGTTITSSVNGNALPTYESSGTGMVALVGGYHHSFFDNFELKDCS